MNSKDLEYIFSNIPSNRMNIYKYISTSNTMRQYISIAKNLGYNFDSGIGQGNQKTLILKRKDGTIIDEIKDRKYPKNTQAGVDIATDKYLSEKYLNNALVHTTHSKIYALDEAEKAKDDFFSEKSSKFAVIKPTNMSQGIGVNVKIDENTFNYYWNDTLNAIGNRKSEVMVQEYFEGFEARAVVILGKLISIVARVPAYVKGNGKNKIVDLIKFKNVNRKKCANLKYRLIHPSDKMIKFLEASGIDMETVPSQSEYVLLSSLSNIGHGGEMVDITDYVSDEIKDIAIESIAAVPGLYSGGIDIMMKSFDDINPAVIEINAWPMLQSTLYPTYGKARNPQEYFLNAFYSLNQLDDNYDNIYKISDSESYIKSYISFQELKIKMFEKQVLDINNIK